MGLFHHNSKDTSVLAVISSDNGRFAEEGLIQVQSLHILRDSKLWGRSGVPELSAAIPSGRALSPAVGRYPQTFLDDGTSGFSSEQDF